MKTRLTFFILVICGFLNGANLIHEFNFNGNFTDQIGGSTLQTIHTNTNSFDGGTWNWTATSSPGGGLLLGAALPDNGQYTLRTVFKFDSFNASWTKIISLTGLTNTVTGMFSSDNGVYFSGTHFGFYNVAFNNTVTYSINTWYDLVLTRNQSGVFSMYIAPLGQTPQLMIQFNDNWDYGRPSRPSTTPGSLSYFGLFYDDTQTTAEWTSGGSVSLIQVWDDTISLSAVQNPEISLTESTVQLNWSTYSGALFYNVYASDYPDGGWVFIGSSPTTGLNLDLTQQRQFYQIRAVLN